MTEVLDKTEKHLLPESFHLLELKEQNKGMTVAPEFCLIHENESFAIWNLHLVNGQIF